MGVFGTLLFFGTALALLLLILTAILAREMTHPPRRTMSYALARGLPCDPGEMDLSYESWQFDRPDGALLPVWEIPGTARGGDGADSHTDDEGLCVIFVHGWGQSRLDFLPLAAPWLPHAERVVLYDLRGHGEAERSRARLGDGEAEDLLALIERLDAKRVLLIGCSMGAVIALDAAAQTAEPAARRIVGVIAYAPYTSFHRSLCGRLQRNHLPTRPVTDLALFGHMLFGVKPRSLDADRLRRIDCPVLVVHGERDIVSPIEHGCSVAETVKDAELLRVPDGEHTMRDLVEAEGHAERVEQLVAKVRGVAGGSRATSHR